MVKTIHGNPWYDQPRYSAARNHVIAHIPKHIRDIEAAKKNLKAAKQMRATKRENQIIEAALGKIRRSYSFIRSELKGYRDLYRWKEFPHLHDTVKKVSQINLNGLETVPGGPVKHHIPNFIVDHAPNKVIENTKSKPSVGSAVAVSSSRSSTAAAFGQRQSQLHANPPMQPMAWYPVRDSVAGTLHPREAPHHGPYSYQGAGSHHQRPPSQWFPQAHDPRQLPQPYWYGKTSQQRYPYPVPYTMGPISGPLRFGAYGYPYGQVAPPFHPSPALQWPPPATAHQHDPRTASRIPREIAIGHKRTRSDSLTDLPPYKRRVPAQSYTPPGDGDAKALENHFDDQGASSETLSNGSPWRQQGSIKSEEEW
ncbi:hypothetical protein VPNG_08897 [Cytospora leucostoma]|uniref:Uncharacterized protein n=1 Tax=Cytospora leucostoma TaxID=1230097 RepID=A0A423VWM9_9PEZI|nr:hypothetical protein VPNG_08897 [Cytospora leucostoma]